MLYTTLLNLNNAILWIQIKYDCRYAIWLVNFITDNRWFQECKSITIVMCYRLSRLVQFLIHHANIASIQTSTRWWIFDDKKKESLTLIAITMKKSKNNSWFRARHFWSSRCSPLSLNPLNYLSIFFLIV